MKKWLLRIGLVLLVAVLGFLGYCYSLPDKMHLERTTEINAPPAVVYHYVSSFKRWPDWEPWGKDFDPSVEHTFAGPEAGLDAERSWTGKKAGSGRQKITAVEENRSVAMDVWFGGEATPSQAALKITPYGTGSRVTWEFDCEFGMNPIGRLFGGMIEKYLGPDYERGLAKLKAVAEEAAAEDHADSPETPETAPKRDPSGADGTDSDNSKSAEE